MNSWYKFLLKEIEEYKLDPQDMSPQEFKEKFINVWRQNKAIRDKLVNDIIKLEINNIDGEFQIKVKQKIPDSDFNFKNDLFKISNV